MADPQCMGPVLTSAGMFLPLLMLRPGVDQPPLGTGEGLRDKDMGSIGPKIGDSA